MKHDMICLMNIILILSISTVLFIYFKSYLLNKKTSFTKVILINIDNLCINYSIKLMLDNYSTYEKIDIWRYFTLF